MNLLFLVTEKNNSYSEFLMRLCFPFSPGPFLNMYTHTYENMIHACRYKYAYIYINKIFNFFSLVWCQCFVAATIEWKPQRGQEVRSLFFLYTECADPLVALSAFSVLLCEDVRKVRRGQPRGRCLPFHCDMQKRETEVTKSKRKSKRTLFVSLWPSTPCILVFLSYEKK